jgi:signal transduction histidine kinase
LRQVFQNLIENAIRFLGEGLRTVEIRCEDLPHADVWEFSVQDTGPGIDPKHHERIFQMFQRLPSPSGSMPEVGTGIGLAVAKKAVEDCGGRVTVASEPGRGSTFSFTVLRHPIRTASSSAVEKP